MLLRTIGSLFCVAASLFAEVQVVAHRGASAYEPENTIQAFELAWELGADVIEADFRITADSRIVCIHDTDTARVADVKMSVEASTWPDLQALRLKSNKNGSASVRIPLIDEVLATIPEGKSAFLELKSGVQIVEPLVNVLRESSVSSTQLTILSFNGHVLQALASEMPELKTILLVSLKRKGTGVSPTASSIAEQADAFQVDGVSVKAHPLMPTEFGEAIKAYGYEFHVWTVDSPQWGIEMVKRGAQSITTNKPDVMKAALQSSNLSSL